MAFYDKVTILTIEDGCAIPKMLDSFKSEHKKWGKKAFELWQNFDLKKIG